MAPTNPPFLPGTLDLIVLQLLQGEPTNGYDLMLRIQAIRVVAQVGVVGHAFASRIPVIGDHVRMLTSLGAAIAEVDAYRVLGQSQLGRHRSLHGRPPVL